MGGGGGGRLFEAGRLLTFSTFRMGAYSRWALIRGWALIRINTVCHQGTCLVLKKLVSDIIRPQSDLKWDYFCSEEKEAEANGYSPCVFSIRQTPNYVLVLEL